VKWVDTSRIGLCEQKLSVGLIKQSVVKLCGGVEVLRHLFLKSTVFVAERAVSLFPGGTPSHTQRILSGRSVNFLRYCALMFVV